VLGEDFESDSAEVFADSSFRLPFVSPFMAEEDEKGIEVELATGRKTTLTLSSYCANFSRSRRTRKCAKSGGNS